MMEQRHHDDNRRDPHWWDTHKIPRNFDFELLSTSDLMDMPDLEWLVTGVIPKPSLCVVYGPPEVGKTFLALSAAASISSGKPWFGIETSETPTLYIAGEGLAGLKLRVCGLSEALEEDLDNCRFIGRSVNILDRKEVDALVKKLKEEAFHPGLIIIDTLARMMADGDENSPRDMGRAVAALDYLKDAFKAAVLVIHHTTKSTSKPRDIRGSGALNGAADVMMLCKTVDGKAVTDVFGHNFLLSCEKMKDTRRFNGLNYSFLKHLFESGNSIPVCTASTHMGDRAPM